MLHEIPITLNFGDVDFSRLETDDDFREAAWALQPQVLQQVGEAAGVERHADARVVDAGAGRAVARRRGVGRRGHVGHQRVERVGARRDVGQHGLQLIQERRELRDERPDDPG